LKVYLPAEILAQEMRGIALWQSVLPVLLFVALACVADIRWRGCRYRVR